MKKHELEAAIKAAQAAQLAAGGCEMKKLWCDLRSDAERSDYILSGQAYDAGIIAHAIQADVAMAFHRCSEYDAEVRRLRDEVNGLTGSADQASAWQEAVEDIASYMSVGVEGCDPVEAAARIKKTSDDFVRVAVQRAERAEAAIAPMVETAQNQQEEIHRLWVTFSKAAEILGLDPQKERRIPRPPSDTFTQAISRLVAERDVALAALKYARELVDDWGAYATAYMQEKHDLAGDLERLDAAIFKVEG